MDFGVPLSALCGGFSEEYFEYGPGIQQQRAFTAPVRRRQSIPYRLLASNQALTGGDMHHLSRSEHFRKYSTYLRVLLRFSEVSEHQDLGASHPPLALGLGLARLPTNPAAHPCFHSPRPRCHERRLIRPVPP